MKAQIIIISNFDEIEKAKAQNGVFTTDVPDPTYVKKQFLFDIKDVKTAWIDHKGDITILMHNEYWTLEYDNVIWTELNLKFKTNGNNNNN